METKRVILFLLVGVIMMYVALLGISWLYPRQVVPLLVVAIMYMFGAGIIILVHTKKSTRPKGGRSGRLCKTYTTKGGSP